METGNPPHTDPIVATKLIMERHREDKCRMEITPRIRYLATYEPSAGVAGVPWQA